MDLFHINRIRELLLIIDDLGLEDEIASHSSPPDQTKRRGRKRHIPPVTTVSRETRAPSGDSQAHRRPIAVPDEKEVIPGSSPVTTSAPMTEADAGQVRDTPNLVETPRPGNNSTPAGDDTRQDARTPNMVDLPCEDSRAVTSAVHANNNNVQPGHRAPHVEFATNTDVKAEEKQSPRHQCRPQPQVTATFTYNNFKPPTPASSNWCKKSKRHHSVPHPRTTHNPRNYPLKDIDQYHAKHYHRVPRYSAY